MSHVFDLVLDELGGLWELMDGFVPLRVAGENLHVNAESLYSGRTYLLSKRLKPHFEMLFLDQ